MKVYVTNESSVLTDAEIQDALPAFQRQCWHVRYWWGNYATLVWGKPPVADAWQIILMDDSDQAGALGYHDFTPTGRPISKIFAKTDQKYGYNWTVTFSHELCEMLVDPWISAAMQISDTQFYALEVGDPVEADEFGYTITCKGKPPVLVSDFVLPNWFIPGSPNKYDYRGHVTKPLEILSGGYMSIFDVSKGWTQVNAQGAEVAMNEKGDQTRPVKYARTRY